MADFTTFRDKRAAAIFSGIFKKNANFTTRIINADLNTRHPQTTPVFHSLVITRDENRDCTTEFVISEIPNSKLVRFTLTLDATAQLLFGWMAYCNGVVAAPTGTPANEIQVLKSTAVAGTHAVDLNFEGVSGASPAVAYNANAATVQSALEKCEAIGRGNVSVTGTALNHVDGLAVEFINDLAKANLPLMTITGTATVTLTTNGANKLHLGSRSTSDALPYFTLVEAFDGDTRPARAYSPLACESVSYRFVRRGKITMTITAIGSADYEEIESFPIPTCSNEPPLRAEDCRFKIGSNYYNEEVREFSFTETNNIDTSEDAFGFAGVHVANLERGDRTSVCTLQVLGSLGDDLANFAEDEETAFDTLEIALGRPGERFTQKAPNAQFRLDDTPVTFVGTKRKSALNITATPRLNDSGVVDTFEYNGAQTAAFLTT